MGPSEGIDGRDPGECVQELEDDLHFHIFGRICQLYIRGYTPPIVPIQSTPFCSACLWLHSATLHLPLQSLWPPAFPRISSSLASLAIHPVCIHTYTHSHTYIYDPPRSFLPPLTLSLVCACFITTRPLTPGFRFPPHILRLLFSGYISRRSKTTKVF